MRNEPLNNDPKTIWQSQVTEATKMSPTYFRLKADQQRTKNRWMALTGDMTYIALLVFAGFKFTSVPYATARVGMVLLPAGTLYMTLRKHRLLWPGPAGAVPVSGVEAYRLELQRWANDLRSPWLAAGPLIPGVVVTAIPWIPGIIAAVSKNPAVLLNALPFFICLTVWLVMFFPLRLRKLREIQQELDSLKD
jgi:hypothetical protein